MTRDAAVSSTHYLQKQEWTCACRPNLWRGRVKQAGGSLPSGLFRVDGTAHSQVEVPLQAFLIPEPVCPGSSDLLHEVCRAGRTQVALASLYRGGSSTVTEEAVSPVVTGLGGSGTRTRAQASNSLMNSYPYTGHMHSPQDCRRKYVLPDSSPATWFE